jgi:hypothetical protein
MILQFLLSILCTIFSVTGNILLLEQELSMLAKSQPVAKPISPLQCTQRPRPLHNPNGACFMNTTINIIARLFCYPEFRDKITLPSPQLHDNIAKLREAIIAEMIQYHSTMTNEQFLNYHTTYFLTTMNDLNFFSVCSGDVTIDVMFNAISALLQDDILMGKRLLNSPAQLLQVRLAHPCTKIDLHCDLFYLMMHSSFSKNYPWPKILIVSTDIGAAQEMIKESAYKQPTGKVAFPTEINIGDYYELKGAPRYQIIGMIASQPNHAFAILKYRSTWYWCNDENLLVLPDNKIQEAQNQGFFKITKDEEIVWLWPIQGKPKYPQDEFAIPAIFIYERVTP